MSTKHQNLHIKFSIFFWLKIEWTNLFSSTYNLIAKTKKNKETPKSFIFKYIVLRVVGAKFLQNTKFRIEACVKYLSLPSLELAAILEMTYLFLNCMEYRNGGFLVNAKHI